MIHTPSAPRPPRHLVDVWNPSYASDVMTAHLTILLDGAKRCDWLVDSFPNVLAEVASLRNPGVHRAHVSREAVVGLRNALVGVGCQGALIELAKVQPK